MARMGVRPDFTSPATCHQFRNVQLSLVQPRAELRGYADVSVDLVLATDVLEHIKHLPEVLSEFRRLLKPTGTLIISIPTEGFLYRQFESPHAGHFYHDVSGAEQVQRELRKQFRLVRRRNLLGLFWICAFRSDWRDFYHDFPGLANPPDFFSPTPALIVSGSPETLTTLRSEGLIANSLFNVLRPNGAIAISLTEVFPTLNSTAENQTLDYGASVVGITSLTSESISFLTSINQSFTIFMRFSIPSQPYKPNSYYNLFYVNESTPTVGWRMASQSFQPGGGPTNLMTLSAYLYSQNHNFSMPGTVSLLWYYDTLDPNVTYDAALVFASGMVSLYINDTFFGESRALNYPLQPMSSAAIFDSGVNATIDDFYVWNSALSASQVGYFSCHSGFRVCG